MINLLYGATGTGKTNELMKMITECVASGKSTLIIVPEQFTFEYERVLCEYMGESLFNNSAIEILSFSRLAKRILHESKTDYEKQQADASMKIAIMYAALKSLIARGQLVYYINQAKKVEFANKALTIITELVTSGVKPENLSAVIEYAPDGIKDKLIDITAIYTEYNIILESKNLRDSSFEITLAKDDANDSDYFSGMNVFFDEFKSFKNDQLALIETIMKQCEDATFSLTTDDLYIEFSNPYKSVSTTAKQIERIAKNQGKKCNKIKLDTYHRYTSNELVFLAENLMRSSDEIYSDKADSINLITATDPYMQCDYVCSQIRNIVCESDKGIKFSDIAVVSRNMDDSISTLKNAFRKYNIPFHTDESPTAKHKSLMVYILSAIELASSSKISTESLLRHLKTGIPNVTIEEINELENFCFKWDIDGVLWDNPFPSEDFRETPDIYEELTYANELRGKAITPIKELSIKLKKAENGKMLCDVIRGLINDVNVKDKLKKQELDATIMLSKNNILSYIDDENTRLKKNLLETLDSLEKIYEDVNISVANFRDVLGLCAENIALATPPQYLDEVNALHLETARFYKEKVVFIIDANDGYFPCTDVADSSFTLRELDFFESNGIMLSASLSSKAAEERFSAFMSILAPSQSVYIISPTTDFSGKSNLVATLVKQIEQLTPNCNKIKADELPLMFYCSTEEAAYSTVVRSFKRDEEYYSIREVLEQNEVYKQKFEYLDELEKSTHKRQHHVIKNTSYIDRLCDKKLNISPSALENYYKCPFKYYCNNFLKLRTLKKNELNPMTFGNIAHYTLCSVLEKYIDKDTKRFRNTSKEAFENDIHEYIEKYVNEQLGGRFSKKSSFDYFLNLLERTLLNVLENMKKEFDECSFVPSGFESRITINVDTLDNDRIINFCGTADRIDTYQDGNAKYVRIIDYKTGNKSKEDIAMHTLVIGINMQLFMYLFMITDSKKGKYKDYEPGGALYYRIAMPSLEKKREIPDERIEKIKEKTHKMFGMVNSSGAVLQAMEKSQKGIFSPSPNNQYDVNNRNDNDIYQFMDEHMIDGMRELSFRLVRDMGENIFSGNIPAYPTFLGNLENSFDDERDYDSIQCEKCDYKEICAYGKDVEIHYLDKEKIDNDVNAIVGGDIDE